MSAAWLITSAMESPHRASAIFLHRRPCHLLSGSFYPGHAFLFPPADNYRAPALTPVMQESGKGRFAGKQVFAQPEGRIAQSGRGISHNG
jgi:hypothetical protein